MKSAQEADFGSGVQGYLKRGEEKTLGHFAALWDQLLPFASFPLAAKKERYPSALAWRGVA